MHYSASQGCEILDNLLKFLEYSSSFKCKLHDYTIQERDTTFRTPNNELWGSVAKNSSGQRHKVQTFGCRPGRRGPASTGLCYLIYWCDVWCALLARRFPWHWILVQRIRIRCVEDSLTHLYHNIQTLGLTQSQYSSSELSTSNQSGTSQLHARNSSGPSRSAATGAGFELESGSHIQGRGNRW